MKIDPQDRKLQRPILWTPAVEFFKSISHEELTIYPINATLGAT